MRSMSGATLAGRITGVMTIALTATAGNLAFRTDRAIRGRLVDLKRRLGVLS